MWSITELDKPTPIIQKIEFTPEEQEDIKNILDGLPKKETIERVKANGWNVENWLKNRSLTAAEYRKKRVRQLYYKGLCCRCDGLPNFKVIYKLDGVALVEHYCTEHFDKII